MKPPNESPRPDAPPGVPGFRTWRGVYCLVLVFFAVCVALLAWFTRSFQ